MNSPNDQLQDGGRAQHRVSLVNFRHRIYLIQKEMGIFFTSGPVSPLGPRGPNGPMLP